MGAVQQLQDEKNALQKSMERMEAKMLVGIRNELMQQVEFVNGVNVISAIVEVSSPEALRKLTMDFKNELKDYLIILATNIGGKPSVAVMLDETIAIAKNIRGIVTTGIADLWSDEETFSLFPNPTKGFVQVQSSYDVYNLRVYNMFGEIIMATSESKFSKGIDFSSFAAGIYIVELDGGRDKIRSQLIKI